MKGRILLAAFLTALAIIGPDLWSAEKSVTLLNVSYDPTRELYQDINEAFSKYWGAKNGEKIRISQSHGGSSKQARSVLEGLPGDVVTLALGYDIDALSDIGKLLPADWRKRLPNNSSPYTSTIIFLVRKGNPKGIKNWDDLIKPGVSVITPNPKTSGSARWNYLAAWGFGLRQAHGNEAKAREFVSKLFKNVPALDSGSRGATSTFVNRGTGDVLINWENEVLLGAKDFAPDKFEIVIPPVSILTEPVVAVVDKVVDRRGTRKEAEGYLEFLYSEQAQEIAAKHYYRPRSSAVLSKYQTQFPKLELFTLEEVAGDWRKAQRIHFNDGGTFDQIYTPRH